MGPGQVTVLVYPPAASQQSLMRSERKNGGSMRKLMIALSLLLLSACNREWRYELVQANENSAYRRDKETGEIHWVVQNIAFPVEIQARREKQAN